MSKMIQLRNVPDALHRKLKARAAEEGMSLSDYLIREVRRSSDIPSDDEIREYLSGNLCRCAGYADILRAVRLAQTRIADSAR